VCGDPGGALALAPVLRALAAGGRAELHNYVYAEGISTLAARGVPARVLSGAPSANVVDDALKHGDVLVAATSVNAHNWEQLFVQRARHFDVPSLALLDFWTNYRARFADREDKLVAVPDVVAAMDERAAEGLRDAGLPASAIVVTGQPAHDELARLRSAMTPARRESLRRDVGAAADDLVVLFLSQPLRALRGLLEDMGYDEEQVLDLVVPAIERAAVVTGRRTTLLIRPHPREEMDTHLARSSPTVRIVVSREGDGREWALAADLVVGMYTALLVDACYLGAVTVSVQPGLVRPDPVPTNVAGLSTAIYAAPDVSPVIGRLLTESTRQTNTRPHLPRSEATTRVVDCIYSLVAARRATGHCTL
jgi:hypothetical protein